MAAMGSPLANRMHTTVRLCALLALTVCLACVSWGQEKQEQQQQPPVIAPPLMKFIPRDERARLYEASNAGERTRTSIELAATHLGRAREATVAGQYEEAAAEMGSYQALYEDALHYLGGMDANRGKVRDLYKRMELALREDVPRIETIRRITPVEYSIHIKAVLEFSKGARAKALESFYGNTVLRETPPGSSTRAETKSLNPASHSSPAPDKQP